VAALVSARRIYRQTLRTYRERAGFLLLVGVLVFVPLGLLDALANQVEGIDLSRLGDLGYLARAALILAFVLQAATTLLGEVFYSGAVALTLVHSRHGHKPTLREIAGALAYGRLIAVDLIFGVAVAIGLVLLLVPGVIVFTWFALAGPLVEIESDGVKDSLARSRRLVRGHFWPVLAVLGTITLVSAALTDVVLALIHDAIGNELLRDWIGESLTNVALSPFYAVAAVLITLRLIDREIIE
jgi:hypothetical protein